MISHDNIAHTRLGKWCEPVNNTIDSNQFMSSERTSEKGLITFGFHNLPAYYSKNPSKLIRSMQGNVFCSTTPEKSQWNPVVGLAVELSKNRVISNTHCSEPLQHSRSQTSNIMAPKPTKAPITKPAPKSTKPPIVKHGRWRARQPKKAPIVELGHRRKKYCHRAE